jgi:hypothetical protein
VKERDESTGEKVDSSRNLSERLLDFGAEVVKLKEGLPNTIAGRRIGDQLLRSGTSVGLITKRPRPLSRKGTSSINCSWHLKNCANQITGSNY